jgi:RNA polymerase sigma factor (TIGR02999 family)
MSEATSILEALGQGDPRAADKLLPLVYQELRQLAAHKMAQEKPGHTLQPTALVHEAWLRIVGNENKAWDGRAHFFGAAAEAMRRILIENVRRKAALRHGGGQQRIDIGEVDFAAPDADDQLLAVDEALDKFGREHKVQSELVKLRYFVGMTLKEAAEVLEISEATANRYWAYARAWLFQEIRTSRKQ